MKYVKLSDKAHVPTKASLQDAGFDLYSCEDYILKPLERKLFKTDITLQIPEGYFGRICDRSGNAYKKGYHVMAGIIDNNFLGNIGVLILNTNSAGSLENIEIKQGDRIAQIIFEKYYNFDFEEVKSIEELNQTSRQDKGFGSSGN